MFLFQVGLLLQVNIEEQPKLALLRKSEEDWAEFAKVSITVSLLLLLFLSLTLSQSTYPANRLSSRIGRKRKSAIEAGSLTVDK